MLHCDADTLALVALGEPCEDAADEEHLRTCAQCRATVSEFAGVVAQARAEQVTLVEPPPAVWSGISAAIAQNEQPVDMSSRRRRSRWWVSVAVAAAVVALLGSFAAGRLLPRADAGSPVATARLARLPDSPATDQATGKAVLRRVSDGYVVDVSTNGMPAPQGFYEVWLMSPDDSGLVSLGTMSAGQSTASFSVPSGLPLTVYTNVDISDEPVDGNPAHASSSILRGQFAA